MTNERIPELIARGALFTCNHSGGKDSQATLITMLRAGIPAKQIVVIHADLGRVEWHGSKELAEKQAREAGCQFEVATAVYKDGSPKDFLNLVEKTFARRPEVPSFPSSDCRTCTSDLKRGPIEKVIKRVMKERGVKLVVNCMGMRASESTDRSKLEPFVHLNTQLNSKGQPKSDLCAAGREAYEWLPIFDLQTLDVWCVIRGAGQMPHAAYQGNERLSCVFCIMGKPADLLHGALARPELFAEYVALEEKTGYTLQMKEGLTLKQIVAKAAAKAGIDVPEVAR